MKCERCNKEHDGSYGSGRFCSEKCAKGFATKINREQINKKVSETLRKKNIHSNGVILICLLCKKEFEVS